MVDRIVSYTFNIITICFSAYLAYRITKKKDTEIMCQKHHDKILILEEKVKQLEKKS